MDVLHMVVEYVLPINCVVTLGAAMTACEQHTVQYICINSRQLAMAFKKNVQK